MARVQLLFMVALLAIVLHVTKAGEIDEVFTARPGKNRRCHQPLLMMQCMSSHLKLPNYSLNGWFYWHTFKSCHPMYTLRGVQNCKINKDLLRTREECETLCAEPCTMQNGTAGICMFNEYCVKNPKTDSNMTKGSCRAPYGASCCLPNYVLEVKDKLATTTTTTKPDKTKFVYKRQLPFGEFIKIRRDIDAGQSANLLGF